MIVCGIVSVICFASVTAFTRQAVLGGLVFGTINGYCFIVLYSLYDKFRVDYESGYNVEYRAPAAKA